MGPRRPRPSEVLLEVFNTAIENKTIWPLISEGIEACIENAASLRKDFLTLVQNKRLPAAQFVYVTCMEEIGKAMILFDVARIDLNPGFLLRLCRAFYRHVTKYAYARVLECPGRGDLAAALERYRIESQEYWPSSPEDGEPDMLADGVFERESALYVDYVVFDGSWFRPVRSTMPRLRAEPGFAFNFESTSGEKAINAALVPIELAQSESLFCPDTLATVNKEFGGLFCNSGCDIQITTILGRLAGCFQRWGIGVSMDTLNANFMRFPLYAAIVAPERVPQF